jgi:hypothetical protein
MERYSWKAIRPLHLGRYAEYFVKMECARAGLDVYTSDVDDRGIDFVIRRDVGRYYDVQVKSIRNMNYVYLAKSVFDLRPGLLLAFVNFREGQPPDLYLIPATAWMSPNALFVDRDYGSDRKSAPEWGMNLSVRNLPLLEPYRFNSFVLTI